MIGQTFGRYRVLEKIGAGGMGEVYRAYDEHLERDVALKILPAGYLTNESARKRFRHEALALSKLNHPNIATVFDFDTLGGVDFLAMELIHGTPVSARLAAGPLPESEVLRLGIQLAEGLAAAHARGVIHRDLKPGNLMITRDGRLKILDFGLAITTDPQGDMDLTRSSAEVAVAAGTVPYMSPEQLRGMPVDARSDLHAAGAVLYEMATGQRPFPQSQGAELVGAILYQTPAPLHTHKNHVSPGFESVVMRSLAKEPAARHQSARELLAALEGVESNISTTTSRKRPVVPVGLALAAVMLAVVAAIVLNMGGLRERLLDGTTPSQGAPELSATPVRIRHSVAVLGFKNLSGRPEEAWLSTALSEMLTTELAAGEQLRTIPGESVSQMKISLSLADAESYSKETLSRIRANVGTDSVVLGSYTPIGNGQIRLDLRLQDTVTGETLAAISERGRGTQIDDLVSRAGAVLRERLGARAISESEAAAVRATLPSNPDAVRLYSAGLARLRDFDSLAARDLLEKAVIADPQYALAHSALADTWSNLGYDERAKREAGRAFELSTNLSREDRFSVEARYRQTTREWGKAVDIYQTLWSFFPDNLDYGLRLAEAQTSAGKARDALATVEELRRLPRSLSADPRIDLAEATAASSLSDFRRAEKVARQAVAEGSARGARFVVARARVSQGKALFDLGEYQQSVRSYENAKEIYAATGDRRGAADALSGLGRVFNQRGDYGEAVEVFGQALAIRRQIGHQAGVAASLTELFVAHYAQKNLPVAKKYADDSLAIARDIDEPSRIATALNNLGIVLDDQGNAGGARKALEEALAIRREIGEKQGVAMSLNNLAQILAARPDLDAARQMFEEALSIGQEIGDKTRVSYSLRALGNIMSKQGDLPEAQRALEQSLTVRNELGAKGLAAETRVSLADVLIDAGHAARGETVAREAVEEFEKQKVALSEASARDVLAQSQLAQGKSAEARQTIDVATTLLMKGTDDRDIRLSIFTTAARVHAGSGEVARAIKGLEAVVSEAATFHLVSNEYEARLALGEAEMQSRDTRSGRSRLLALEKDAASNGFHLIARKARASARVD